MGKLLLKKIGDKVPGCKLSHLIIDSETVLDLRTTTKLVLEDLALHNQCKFKKIFMNGRLGDKMRSNFLQLQFVETNSINLCSLVNFSRK